MYKNNLFQVEVWQEPRSVSGVVDLPASAWELEDAAEKARMDPTQDCKIKIFWGSRDFQYLNRVISGRQNLFELNLLAERLSKLNEFEQLLFEGRFTMAKEENPKQNPPVADLINMTYELDSCHLIAEAEADQSLGQFYFDNDMLMNFPEIPDDLVKYINFAEVGRVSRITEHGVFTPAGYVVDDNWPNLPQEYTREKLAPPSSSAPIVLEVSRGCFNESEDNSPTIRLELPITDGEAESLLHNLGVSTWEACGYHCADCAIPAFKEVLDGNRADLGELNEVVVAKGEDKLIEISNDKKAQIVVTKRDNQTGEVLRGAIIKATLLRSHTEPYESGMVYTRTTGEDGRAVFDNMIPGEYRVEETSPPQFYLPTTTVHTVNVYDGCLWI